MGSAQLQSSLFEAAAKGCINSLQQLLIYDPSILERDLVNCFKENPLHVAAALGHIDFVKKLIEINPQLVYELNLQKRCPLHLAAAKGHVDVVKALLSVARLACLASDNNGLTPVHLAAIKGRDEAVKLLLAAQPDAARMVVYEEKETILHLCVKNHQLQALKLVLATVNEPEFINSKDANGNTALHLAVADKQLQTTNFLVSIGATSAEVNTQNQNQDGLTESPAVLIHESQTTSSSSNSSSRNRSTDEALMVVATLVASMIFQVGANPPGGVWQEDNFLTDSNGRFVDPQGRPVSTPVDSQNNTVYNPHHAGYSVLAHKHPKAYSSFCFQNVIGFFTSMFLIYILMTGWQHLESNRMCYFMYVVAGGAYISVAFSYSSAVIAVTPDNQAVSRFMKYLPSITLFFTCAPLLWVFVKLAMTRRPIEVVEEAPDTEMETGRILRTNQPSSAVV